MELLDSVVHKIEQCKAQLERFETSQTNYYEPTLKRLKNLIDIEEQFHSYLQELGSRYNLCLVSNVEVTQVVEQKQEVSNINQNDVTIASNVSPNVQVNINTLDPSTFLQIFNKDNQVIETANLNNSATSVIESQPQSKNYVNRDTLTQLLHSYKDITNKTFTNCMNLNTMSEVTDCACLCKVFFETRFDKNNDPNHIHKFNARKFKEYLISLVYTYCCKNADGELESFIEEFNLWKDKVIEGTHPYTLPFSVLQTFKNLETDDYKYDQSVLQDVNLIWKYLWNFGFYEFSKIVIDDGADISLPTEDIVKL